MSELLPCPFCGNTNLNEYDAMGGPAVCCWPADSSIPRDDLCPISGKIVLVEQWNTRTYPPHVQAVLDAANDEAHLHTVGMTPDGRPFEYPCECHFCLAVKAYNKQTAPPTQDKPRSDKD